jgi:membrane fusion protein (multidrug efflux system)
MMESNGTKTPLSRKARNYVKDHPFKLLIFIVLLLALIAAAVYLWFYLESYVSTDDAQVDAYLNPVTSRINGTVVDVHVENNQHVNKGQLLVDLDPRDYQVAVEQARAAYARAQSEISAQSPNVPITETSTATLLATSESAVASAEAAVGAAERDCQSALADLRQAEANNVQAQSQLKRYEMLVKKDEVSRLQFDQIKATAQASAAVVDSRRAAAEAARKLVAQRQQSLRQAQKQLAQVRANTPHQLNCRHCSFSRPGIFSETSDCQFEDF